MFDSGDARAELLQQAIDLGARSVPHWTGDEFALTDGLRSARPDRAERIGRLIAAGADPLGERFHALHSPLQRRPLGATYTPLDIVDAMVRWAAGQGEPGRIIDPGCGSGRFLVAAGRMFPRAELVGIDIDPLATVLTRANLAASGFERRSRVLLGDYRGLTIEKSASITLFIGNPPYVRHHDIDPVWKRWLTTESKHLGLKASQLSGLHVHFFLATLLHASPGDLATFITSSEWMDVNYGELARRLFLDRLGGKSLHIVNPRAEAFPGTQTTAAISTFRVGARPEKIGVDTVESLTELGSLVPRFQLAREHLDISRRWTVLTRPVQQRREGYIELGELCRVHRGQVTGKNRVWIAGQEAKRLPPSVLFRSVTKARELFRASGLLSDPTELKFVIDLPVDLSCFEAVDRKAIDAFLRFARSLGADQSYIAKARKAWWSVGLRAPAPILATYMARRPPAFIVNAAQVRHINVAHGLYPRVSLSAQAIARLASYLSRHTDVSDGRTYSGGLTKFEPREMERLLIPSPQDLESSAWEAANV